MSVHAALLRAGVPRAIAAAEAPRASAAMRENAITTRARARDFLAQVLHESAGLRYFEEIASGAAYEGRRDLGNTRAGDGRRFKGRGPIQLTGRANYRWAGGRLGLPLESNPALAARHDIGWRIAALYWSSRGLNALADRGDFLGITRRINGGTNGWADRVRYRKLITPVDARPDPLAVLTATERRLVVELDRRRKRPFTGANAVRRRKLVADLTRRRKAIWREAQRTGWGRADRKARYRLLLARTR